MHKIRQNARPTIRERREKREPRSERERDDRASPRRRAVRSTSALVRRSRRSSDAHRSPIDERRDRPTRDERARRLRSSIVDRAAQSTIAIVHHAARRRGEARSSLSLWSGLSLLSSLSLSLSLFFRKWIEVKMRGEIHFRVKGEICGQPEIIFRKIMFSVTAKRMDFPEIDFWNWFSPDSNAALVTTFPIFSSVHYTIGSTSNQQSDPPTLWIKLPNSVFLSSRFLFFLIYLFFKLTLSETKCPFYMLTLIMFQFYRMSLKGQHW